MNLSLSLVSLSLALMFTSGCQNSAQTPFIAVDQVGYRTDGPKQAFQIHGQARQFELLRAGSSEVIETLSVKEIMEPDLATGDQLATIDFSTVEVPGEYQIRSVEENPLLSEPFSISSKPHLRVLPVLVKSFYYHRCGSRVSDGTEWGYEQCHLDDAELFNHRGEFMDVTGGWHDAGDYNKFSVNTSLSATLLLYAYEHNPNLFSEYHSGTPGSGNGLPDILDEVSRTLRWLLKMQAENGAVYHKVSQKKWIGEFMPDRDPATRYLFGYSSTATASFSATTALGARILSGFEPELSDELKDASRRAWAYLLVHPENVPAGGFKNPQGVSGGEYGDVSDLDERLWAAAELHRITGDSSYTHYISDHYQELLRRDVPPLSWRNVHSLAIQAILSWPENTISPVVESDIRERLVERAEATLLQQADNNYRTLLRTDEYYWGSNSVGLGYAFELLQAYRITNRTSYLNAATDQLHYLFGRNPFNRSQITGVGSRTVEHPYHQLSETGGFTRPVPGMLVGGPNASIHLNNKPISTYPGKNYEDQFKNYLVNEPAINYTAILACVVAMASSTESQTDQLHSIEELTHR